MGGTEDNGLCAYQITMVGTRMKLLLFVFFITAELCA
jgi:hypothetical protein